MILLIGGTSETAPLASGLAAAGYAVLVSMATAAPLAIGDHPRISRRAGRLDEEGMVALGKEKGIRAIVDAAHPYAEVAHEAAHNAAKRLGIPYLVFRRPDALTPESPVRFAADHAEAAEMAFASGRPVLLTTGSRNLAPYAEAARRTGIPFAVRVLGHGKPCRHPPLRDRRDRRQGERPCRRHRSQARRDRSGKLPAHRAPPSGDAHIRPGLRPPIAPHLKPDRACPTYRPGSAPPHLNDIRPGKAEINIPVHLSIDK
jgi:hypothetical protein